MKLDPQTQLNSTIVFNQSNNCEGGSNDCHSHWRLFTQEWSFSGGDSSERGPYRSESPFLSQNCVINFIAPSR